MSGESRSSRTIFLEALEVTSTAARQQFVDLACGNDASLRAEVQRLLDAHGNLNNFMGQPAANSTEAYIPVEFEQVGAMVGRYKLLEQIGEGGMGVVYVAEQTEPVRRRVGVKLIRAERGNSSAILARFEAERQAIALMDHPNIAKLLDAGTTDAGAPYFVMELVKGVPLTEYCDAHRLTVSQRLQLFQQICSAVQHAHQKGIIHRDLKPSNILVESHDGKPVPKVIDFGLAKATSGMQLTEHTLYTGFGTVAGTPQYMAPEQARFDAIDVDTRADIYALGVLLYELLTGTTPITRETIKKAAFDEVLRLVREQEAPTPSSRISSSDATPSVAENRRAEPMKLGRLVKGELDWIVMKSLSKERERRYETASGFANDIERFLNHEPVQAGPPSVRYRLKKFARRNRPQVIAASLVLAALVTGTVGTTLGLVWAIRAEGVAEQRLDDAEAARKKAEQAEDKTLAAYRENTDDAIEQLIGSKPELGPQEKAYLNKVLRRWQAFATRQGTDERSRAISSEGHFRVATLWERLGQQVDAQREYQAAREIATRLVEDFPTVPKHQQDLATTHGRLGLQWRTVGNNGEALAECRAARDLQQKLVEQFPSEPEYREDLATTHCNLGILLAEQADSDAAQAEYEAARTIQKSLVEKFPAVLAYQQGLALTHRNLGTVLIALGKEEAARTEFQAARDIVQKLAQRKPAELAYQQDLAGAHVSLGNQLRRFKKWEAAQAEYEAARAIQKSLAERFPAVPAYLQVLAGTHNNLGIVFSDLGKREAARAEYEAARDIGKLLVERFRGVPEHVQYLGVAHNNLAILLAEMGNSEEAQAEYLAARDIGERLVKQFPTVPAYRKYLADTHNNLGTEWHFPKRKVFRRND